MRKLIGALSAGLVAGAALVAVAGPANAETEIVVFKDQIVQPDTRSGGHVNWPIGGGIRLSTDSNTSLDKATAVFALTGSYPLDGAALGHDVNVKSGGDQATPGMQVYLQNGALLVWENVYQVNGEGVADNDLWLTNGSPSAIKQLAPSCDGTPEAVTDPASHCVGGSGTYWHGSQAAWAAAINDAAGTNIVALGESLGSGVKGNVLVTSINYGDTYWTFSRQNAPVVPEEPVEVDPKTRVVADITGSCRQAVVTITLPEAGPDEVYTASSVGYRHAAGGALVQKGTLVPGGSYTSTLTYSKTSGSIVVKAFTGVSQSTATTLLAQLAVNRNCNTVGAGPITHAP